MYMYMYVQTFDPDNVRVLGIYCNVYIGCFVCASLSTNHLLPIESIAQMHVTKGYERILPFREGQKEHTAKQQIYLLMQAGSFLAPRQ